MVSLADIVPQTRTVEIAQGSLELRGLGLRHIAELFLRFSELRKFFSPNAPDFDLAVLLTEMPDAIAAIIAEAAGQPEAAERIADVLSADDTVACLLAVKELTITPPFFERLAMLLHEGGVNGRLYGREAVTTSPPPPSN